MSLSFVVKPAAEDDILEAFAWYEEKRPGLGPVFLAEIENAFERIRERPGMYQEVIPEVRRGVTHTFP